MKPLNGYRATHKNKWLLLKYISIQAVCLWDFYVDISDFDKDHYNYGKFELVFTDVASLFKVSENTIRNWHNELLLVGLIRKIKPHLYEISNPERYMVEGKWKGKAQEYATNEKNQSDELILQNIVKHFQTVEEKLQPIVKKEDVLASQKQSIYLGSSKDQSRDHLVIEAVPTIQKRSKQEYEEILQEGNYKELEVRDLELIDQSLSNESPDSQLESSSVRPHQKEKLLAEKVQKVIDIPLVNHFQLTPTERFYVAIADKFPDPNSYFAWKERKQKSGQWKN